MPEFEENEHAQVPVPESTYRVISNAWYVELTVPHPKNPEQPPQSMTILVPSQWCAKFIDRLVENMEQADWEEFANDPEIPFQ